MDPIDQPIPDTIDVKTSSYFPLNWRISAVAFSITGLFIAPINIYVGLILTIGGILVLTTYYGIRIDFNERTYFDYTWIVGFKSGERGRFDNIQYIYINRTKYSQTMSSRVQSTSTIGWEFNGYLKFSDTQKLHLRTSRSKTAIVRHMQVLGAKLKCQVHDLTGN